jgi:HK97 family phage prohead protease
MMDSFREVVLPGAFKKSIREQGPAGRNAIKVNFDHGFDAVCGTRPLGVLTDLREDDVGLFYSCELVDTSYNRDLIPLLSAGLLGASVRMRVIRDSWSPGKKTPDNPDALDLRSISEIALYELGPVSWPASLAATAGVRSRSEFERWARDTDTVPRVGPNRRQRVVEYLKIWGNQK